MTKLKGLTLVNKMEAGMMVSKVQDAEGHTLLTVCQHESGAIHTMPLWPKEKKHDTPIRIYRSHVERDQK